MPKIVHTKTVWVDDKNVRIKFPKAAAWTKEDGTECATNYIRFQSDRSETNYNAAQHSRDLYGMGQSNDHVPLHASALSLNHPFNKLGDGPKLYVQLDSPYDVNYGTPYKTGGLNRDMQFYNQANGPNKEVFNKHYNSLGRGTLVTTKDKFELLCKKTYDPVSDKTKYALSYHVQNNVISSLWFRTDGSAVGALNWMHPGLTDTWWTDRNFQELTWDKYLTHRPQQAWAWCTCPLPGMSSHAPQTGFLLVDLVWDCDDLKPMQSVKMKVTKVKGLVEVDNSHIGQVATSSIPPMGIQDGHLVDESQVLWDRGRLRLKTSNSDQSRKNSSYEPLMYEQVWELMLGFVSESSLFDMATVNKVAGEACKPVLQCLKWKRKCAAVNKMRKVWEREFNYVYMHTVSRMLLPFERWKLLTLWKRHNDGGGAFV